MVQCTKSIAAVTTALSRKIVYVPLKSCICYTTRAQYSKKIPQTKRISLFTNNSIALWQAIMSMKVHTTRQLHLMKSRTNFSASYSQAQQLSALQRLNKIVPTQLDILAFRVQFVTLHTYFLCYASTANELLRQLLWHSDNNM